MAGTPATLPALIGQFPTTIGAGQFRAQQIQNLIATFAAATPTVSVLQYGAVGNGSTSDTAAIIAAIAALPAAGGSVYFPGGFNYRIAPASIALPSNIRLFGDGNNSIISVAASTTSNFLSATSKTDIVIENLQFVSSDDQTTAVFLQTCTRAIIRNCSATGPVLVQTYQGTYASMNSGNYCYDLIITDNTATAVSLGAGAQSGIDLNYVTRATVTGNIINGHSNGIFVWGGDANPTQNGIGSNARKAAQIAITGNVVTGSAGGGGGIITCMGQGVIVTGNECIGTSTADVGIDFEGSFDCRATGNYVQDYPNGGLSVFFRTKDVAFDSNTVVNTGTNNPLLRVYNDSIDPTLAHSLSITNNVFASYSGLGVIDDASGSMGDVVISGNRFIDTHVVFNQGSANVSILNNDFIFYTTQAAMHVIDLQASPGTYSGSCQIAGNRVTCSASQNASSIFIYVMTNDFNNSVTTIIQDNKNSVINPIATDITLVEAGTNAGISGVYFVRNNMLTGATHLTRTESGSKAMFVRWEGNYDATLTPYPLAIAANSGDANVTITSVTASPVLLFSTTLTANRTVTLPTGDLYNGRTFKVVRTGLGAFTLAVGSAKTIPSATAAYVEVTYNSNTSAWQETGYGTL